MCRCIEHGAHDLHDLIQDLRLVQAALRAMEPSARLHERKGRSRGTRRPLARPRSLWAINARARLASARRHASAMPHEKLVA
eukprot:10546948-Alexandrium_andersonii.AAC.1